MSDIIQEEEYLLFFEECKVVKGIDKAILYDLGRPENSNEVPLEFYDFYISTKKHDVKNLFNQFPNEDHNVIKEYIDFSLNNQYATLGDKHLKEHLDSYPEKVDKPRIFENAIVILENLNITYLSKLEKILSEIDIKAIELRLLKTETEQEIITIEKIFETSSIESIILRVNSSNTYKDIEGQFRRIRKLFVYSNDDRNQSELGNIQYESRHIDLDNEWGQNNRRPKVIDRVFFLESQYRNLYHHGKLFIDKSGGIKSNPLSQVSFGNVNNIKTGQELLSKINNDDFKQFWNISKDQIEECKECCLRYMCLDYREPTIDRNGNWKFETKCDELS